MIDYVYSIQSHNYILINNKKKLENYKSDVNEWKNEIYTEINERLENKFRDLKNCFECYIGLINTDLETCINKFDILLENVETWLNDFNEYLSQLDRLTMDQTTQTKIMKTIIKKNDLIEKVDKFYFIRANMFTENDIIDGKPSAQILLGYGISLEDEKLSFKMTDYWMTPFEDSIFSPFINDYFQDLPLYEKSKERWSGIISIGNDAHSKEKNIFSGNGLEKHDRCLEFYTCNSIDFEISLYETEICKEFRNVLQGRQFSSNVENVKNLIDRRDYTKLIIKSLRNCDKDERFKTYVIEQKPKKEKFKLGAIYPFIDCMLYAVFGKIKIIFQSKENEYSKEYTYFFLKYLAAYALLYLSNDYNIEKLKDRLIEVKNGWVEDRRYRDLRWYCGINLKKSKKFEKYFRNESFKKND